MEKEQFEKLLRTKKLSKGEIERKQSDLLSDIFKPPKDDTYFHYTEIYNDWVQMK